MLLILVVHGVNKYIPFSDVIETKQNKADFLLLSLTFMLLIMKHKSRLS